MGRSSRDCVSTPSFNKQAAPGDAPIQQRSCLVMYRPIHRISMLPHCFAPVWSELHLNITGQNEREPHNIS